MIRKQLLTVLACVVMTLLAFGLASAATTYYVRAGSGNDGNAGTSSAAPWKTITHALANISPGDTVNVLPGAGGAKYDMANGETFPLAVADDNITLVGIGSTVHPKVVDASGSGKRVFTVVGYDNVTIKFLEICFGSATDASPGNRGGGVYVNDCQDITIADCEIHDNTAGNHGGGIYIRDSSGLIDQNVISGNTASVNKGGGIYVLAPTNGDAVEDQGTESPLVIRDNCLYENACGDSGGAIYLISNDSQASKDGGDGTWLFNNLIFENTAGASDAGAVQIGVDDTPKCANVRLDNNTIAHNTYTGLYGEDQCCTAGQNNIIWGNGPSDMDDVRSASGGLTLDYSDIDTADNSNYTPGTGNWDKNPMWQSTYDYFPCDGYFLNQASSPCVDSGNGDGDDADKYGDGSDLSNTRWSTDVNEKLDTNTVDRGYHYKFHGGSYIELSSFSADARADRVVVKWETATEIDNAGFLVYRCDNEASDCHKVSNFIAADGDAVAGASYSFIDSNVVPGSTYYYYLVDVDTSGKWTVHGPVSVSIPVKLRAVLDLKSPTWVR